MQRRRRARACGRGDERRLGRRDLAARWCELEISSSEHVCRGSRTVTPLAAPGSAAIDVCGTPGRLTLTRALATCRRGRRRPGRHQVGAQVMSGSGHLRNRPATAQVRAGARRLRSTGRSRVVTGSGDIAGPPAQASLRGRVAVTSVSARPGREPSSSRRGLATSGSGSLAVWQPRSTSSRAPARPAASSTWRIGRPSAARSSASRRGQARAKPSSPERLTSSVARGVWRSASLRHATIPPRRARRLRRRSTGVTAGQAGRSALTPP